jgi:hypothetical protein
VVSYLKSIRSADRYREVFLHVGLSEAIDFARQMAGHRQAGTLCKLAHSSTNEVAGSVGNEKFCVSLNLSSLRIVLLTRQGKLPVAFRKGTDPNS